MNDIIEDRIKKDYWNRLSKEELIEYMNEVNESNNKNKVWVSLALLFLTIWACIGFFAFMLVVFII